MKRLPQTLLNKPAVELMNYMGYFSKREKTMLPPNVLTKGSLNCFIPDGDKVIPRPGSSLFGQEATEETGIIGHYKKYKNLGGVEMEVRAFRSEDLDNPNLNDVIQVQWEGQFVSITENPNPIPKGTGRIYFDVFFDTDLNPSESKNLPRLVWVDGYADPTTKKGRIFSWTGGIAEITGVTGSTVSLPTGTTWRELGFTENKNGDAFIVVNGKAYELDDSADLDTNTIDVTSTTGITVGDIATAQIEVDEAPLAFDMCKQNQGYMFYGNFNRQQWYMSNAFGRPSTQTITQALSQKNDMFLPSTSIFTGTGANTYKVQIDSIDPAVNTVTFNNSGANVLTIDTSGYTEGTTLNTYTFYITQPAGPLTTYGYELYKNGTLVSFNPLQGPSGAGVDLSFTYDGIDFFIPAAIVGNLLPIISSPFTDPHTDYTGALVVGSSWQIVIKDAGNDTFSWSFNNGAPLATNVAITGSAQSLSNGISIEFISTTGHAVGDFWVISVNQSIGRAWAEFYYSIDIETQGSARRPGEGYIYKLPSNFWTMQTLENSIFVNTSNGEWGYVTSQLSADLKSEDISFTPLKQAGANKVLYPYLTGHSQNDLLFINEDKQLDSIGRIQLTEKLQIDYISDPVRHDFTEASFINGSIEYQDKKIWVTSPQDFIMFCYDDVKDYWQPPQAIPQNAILTVIGNKLASHSDTTNSTRILNNKEVEGDDGKKYEVVVRTGTYDHGLRWQRKTANQTYWEAYIYRIPDEHTLAVHLDVDEPDRTRRHNVTPVFGARSFSSAVFGGGEMGEHSFGSDESTNTPYAREIYPGLGDIDFYFSSMEYRVESKVHLWELLSMGTNLVESKGNNKNWIPNYSPIQRANSGEEDLSTITI